MIQKNPEMFFIDGCGRCKFAATPNCKVNLWTVELGLLRQIALDSGLKEEMKWGMPCYTFNNSNVIMIVAFKTYCALSFFKGTLLKDDKKILQSPGDNSQAVKMFKATSAKEIIKHKKQITNFIKEAIALEKSGAKIEFKKPNELSFPEELLDKFKTDKKFKVAFESLTPGRQKGYILFFSQAKQAKTRIDRIEKCSEKIFNGIGLHD
jgi:uncharacterized protein YdeI (YjbR/CyaY-like superfamily)